MSFYGPRPSFATVVRSFAHDDGLPFADVLSAQTIQDACDAENVHFGQDEGDIYTPAVTLWAFLAQCLSASKSCVAAVARVLVLRLALGLPPLQRRHRRLLQGPRQAASVLAAPPDAPGRHGLGATGPRQLALARPPRPVGRRL